MTTITKYGISGILVCLALGSYLSFLAQRDEKMIKYYQQRTCESFTYHPDCP